MAEAPKTTGDTGATKPATEQQDTDEIMKIRKQTGSIAEVIEPVQRTRLERTDR